MVCVGGVMCVWGGGDVCGGGADSGEFIERKKLGHNQIGPKNGHMGAACTQAEKTKFWATDFLLENKWAHGRSVHAVHSILRFEGLAGIYKVSRARSLALALWLSLSLARAEAQVRALFLAFARSLVLFLHQIICLS